MMTLEKAIALLGSEYTKAMASSHIRNPLAYALYQVWKMADTQPCNRQFAGKCGSCEYAKPTVAFGGSRCYIECTNRPMVNRTGTAHIKQRTTKACKRYKQKEEVCE